MREGPAGVQSEGVIPTAPGRLVRATRVFYERWLGMLDATVGKMLGDPDPEKRGAALTERSDGLRRAAQLDDAATRKQRA